MKLNMLFLKKVGIILVGFCLSLLIAEMLLRIFWVPPFLDQKFIRDDLKWTRENVVLNRFGYRDKELDLINKQKYRIYMLGDSYTYGWYINDADITYPRLIEKKLNGEYNQNIEVINASRPGFGLKDSVDRLESEGLVFSPDMVTLGINIFDITDKQFSPKYIKNEFLQSLRLYHLTFGNVERLKTAAKVNDLLISTYSDNSPQIKKAEERLRRMKELTDSIGAKLVIIVFPSFNPENPNQPYVYFNFHSQVKKITDKLGIQVIDLYEQFSAYKDKRELVLNPTDPHPSIIANRLAAETIVEKVDFGKLISEPRVNIETVSQTIYPGLKFSQFHGVLALDSPNWVFFNTVFGANTQSLLMSGSNDEKIPYLADVLKTAKAFTHEGWTGAKIEYNLLGGRSMKVSPKLYGFKVTGISQITGFWENKKALNSIDLSLSEVSVKKDENNIIIDVKHNIEFSLYRVTVDIAVSQFDITDGIVGDIFSTKLYQQKLNSNRSNFEIAIGAKIGSTPRYVSNGEGTGYVWINNEMTSVDFEKKERNLDIKFKSPQKKDSLLEFVLAEEGVVGSYPKILYK